MSFNCHFNGKMNIEDCSVAEDNREAKGNPWLYVLVMLLELFSGHEGCVCRRVGLKSGSSCPGTGMSQYVRYGGIVVRGPADTKYLFSESSGLVLGPTGLLILLV
jgi:hypothetical protein